jgi:hypothetical protein
MVAGGARRGRGGPPSSPTFSWPNVEDAVTLKRYLIVSAVLSIALASSLFFAQKPPAGTAKKGASEGSPAEALAMPGIVQPVDLSGSSRACAEASSFLSQPQLAEAVAKARSDKKAAKEASQDAGAYLAKNGVNVPGDIRVRMNPSGGGHAEAVKITITIRCCPPEIIITIQF